MQKKPSDALNEFEDYIFRVSKRLSNLEIESEETEKTINKHDEGFNSVSELFTEEIDRIKKESNQISIDVKNTVRELHNIAKEFQNLTKKEQLDKIKKKIDDWAPETFINKSYANKVLKN
ncbi:MAG: hypothetical protein ABIC91_02170 [Nanoarchaeota archaeon]|nr:hypothetical protein [Nanoarchaeota archaeon]MBU1030154.1 hypothetical protein [Nanoarchaeota archaeon]MBU1850430.1 hypothetical protein [Nanoarchaeota archaeon]